MNEPVEFSVASVTRLAAGNRQLRAVIRDLQAVIRDLLPFVNEYEVDTPLEHGAFERAKRRAGIALQYNPEKPHEP